MGKYIQNSKLGLWVIYAQVVQWLRICSAGDTKDTGLITWSGRSSGVGNGNPLQYVCLGS